jgi:hypothetical protein
VELLSLQHAADGICRGAVVSAGGGPREFLLVARRASDLGVAMLEEDISGQMG